MIPLMKNTFLNEATIKEELAQFILHAKMLSMGEECINFERKFANFQGVNEAVLFNSGGSANLAMLQALKNLGRLKYGDKVGFSALTWSTNLMPIIQLGMLPVPIDCATNTLNVMSIQLKKRLDEFDIRAMFITNALGFSGDLNVIQQICNERNVILIEDNCEALGTELPTGKTGSFGEMASFSFYVAHHMSTIEGGMVCTFDEELAEMLRIVRANGWDRNLSKEQQSKWRKKFNVDSELDAKYTFYELGYSIRPTEITGFIGCRQLPLLKETISTRQKNYSFLEAAIKNNPDLIVPDRSHISLLSNFAFPVLCKTAELRRRYIEKFSKAEVEIRPMIAGNIQKQPFYKKYIPTLCELPGTDKIHECGFYCGNYPELSQSDLQIISNCLRES